MQMQGTGPDLAFINQQVQNAIHPPQQQQSAQPDKLRLLMYLLQAADSLNTSNFLKHPNTRESDPLMKPFAKPGNPLPMMGAYGAEDLGIGALKNPRAQHTAEILQILMNVLGIGQTEMSKKNFGKP